MEGLIKGNKTVVTVLNIFLLLLIIISVRMTYSYDISQRYAILFLSIFMTFILVVNLNKQQQHLYWGIVIYSVAIWIIESYLYRLRGTPLQTFAPSTLMTIYTSTLMGFLLVFLPIRLKWLRLLMYLFIGFNFFLIVVMNKPVDEVFDSETSSGVGLLSLTLSMVIPVMYLEYREHNKISLLPLVLQMLISLFVASRTGLGTCVILLFFAIFAAVQSKKNVSKRIGAFIAFGVILLLVFFIIMSNSSDMDGIAKTVELEGDLTGRDLIWANYFFNFDINNLIYGRDIVGINEGEWQNAHNSWIQLHSNTGIIGIGMLLLVIRLLIYYVKRNLFIALLLLTLIIYSFFNYFFFFNLNDRLIYLFFFDFLLTKKQNTKESPQIKISFI